MTQRLSPAFAQINFDGVIIKDEQVEPLKVVSNVSHRIMFEFTFINVFVIIVLISSMGRSEIDGIDWTFRRESSSFGRIEERYSLTS